VIDLDVEPQIEMTEDEKITFVAERILREHKAAFQELAK
jgi:antitoxin Phd